MKALLAVFGKFISLAYKTPTEQYYYKKVPDPGICNYRLYVSTACPTCAAAESRLPTSSALEAAQPVAEDTHKALNSRKNHSYGWPTKATEVGNSDCWATESLTAGASSYAPDTTAGGWSSSCCQNPLNSSLPSKTFDFSSPVQELYETRDLGIDWGFLNNNDDEVFLSMVRLMKFPRSVKNVDKIDVETAGAEISGLKKRKGRMWENKKPKSVWCPKKRRLKNWLTRNTERTR